MYQREREIERKHNFVNLICCEFYILILFSNNFNWFCFLYTLFSILGVEMKHLGDFLCQHFPTVERMIRIIKCVLYVCENYDV